jgi:hypothetical protein
MRYPDRRATRLLCGWDQLRNADPTNLPAQRVAVMYWEHKMLSIFTSASGGFRP